MTIQTILWMAGVALLIFLGFILISGIRFIPNNRIGIVEKRFGDGRLRGGFIALKGEAGLPAGCPARRYALPDAFPIRVHIAATGDHSSG